MVATFWAAEPEPGSEAVAKPMVPGEGAPLSLWPLSDRQVAALGRATKRAELACRSVLWSLSSWFAASLCALQRRKSVEAWWCRAPSPHLCMFFEGDPQIHIISSPCLYSALSSKISKVRCMGGKCRLRCRMFTAGRHPGKNCNPAKVHLPNF